MSITGSDVARVKAREQLNIRIDQLLDTRFMDRIAMPQTAVSALIGKRGDIIRNINRLSGA